MVNLTQDPGLPVPRPTQSYWQEPLCQNLQNIQSTKLPPRQDIVIIGSGVSGCSAAWSLLNESSDVKITVLEAREICSGATGRNGGRINCTAVQDFDKYSRFFGQHRAAQIVRFELAHFQAISDLLKSISPELYQRSELRWVDAISAAFDDRKLGELSIMLRAFEDAMPEMRGRWTMIGRAEVSKKYSITTARGALIGKAGAVWPYRAVTGIFDHLRQNYPTRLSLEANTPVLKIESEDSAEYPFTVMTSRGQISARHVLHCTEGHSAHLLPLLRGILVPRKGQMTVQNPGIDFPERGDRSWSFNIQQGLDYATQNPRSGDIFIGGGDSDGKSRFLGQASDAEDDLTALGHLGGILPAVFGRQNWGAEEPGKVRVKASWSGVMCNSLDHVPLVGKLPQQFLEKEVGTSDSGQWISAGYGGYGMVNAFLCGRAVAKMILGHDVTAWLPEPYLLSPGRATRLRFQLQSVRKTQKEHLQALL